MYVYVYFLEIVMAVRTCNMHFLKQHTQIHMHIKAYSYTHHMSAYRYIQRTTKVLVPPVYFSNFRDFKQQFV